MDENATSQTSPTKKIVIVDDDHAFLEAIAEKLRSDTLQVLTATDGEEGLKLILKEHPELVVTDVVLPGKTGPELLRELRNDPWGAHVRVVMVSNVESIDAYNEALSAGANDYYSKNEVSLEDMAKFITERV